MAIGYPYKIMLSTICRRCASDVAPEDRFCQECGLELTVNSAETTEKNDTGAEPHPISKQNALFKNVSEQEQPAKNWLALVLVVAFVGGLGYWASNKPQVLFKKPETKSSKIQTSIPRHEKQELIAPALRTAKPRNSSVNNHSFVSPPEKAKPIISLPASDIPAVAVPPAAVPAIDTMPISQEKVLTIPVLAKDGSIKKEAAGVADKSRNGSVDSAKESKPPVKFSESDVANYNKMLANSLVADDDADSKPKEALSFKEWLERGKPSF